MPHPTPPPLRSRPFALLLPTLLFTLTPISALAQIIPDDTLGDERSQVLSADAAFGLPFDFIDGGARREANLFHSFSEFNVAADRAAFFFSTEGIERIFSRVTGNNPSNILGTLGVIDLLDASKPDLFLINPNGVIFGENAVLDLEGSFAVTTANAIQFGPGEMFSASNPTVPSELLTIAPSAFLFSQIPGDITINGSAIPVSPSGLGVTGEDNTLLVLGGDVTLDGGRVGAVGGRVEVGAIAGPGTIDLSTDERLTVPDTVDRANVLLTNGAIIGVPSANGGSITMTAQDIQLEQGAILLAGLTGEGDATSQAGNITLNARGTVRLTDASVMANALISPAMGTGGNIEINTARLEVVEGAQVQARTDGQGDAGNVTIQASDRVRVAHPSSGIFSNVDAGGVGNGGRVTITTPILDVLDGAQLQADTNGIGDAGQVVINAGDRVTFDQGSAFSEVRENGGGTGGDLLITAPVVEVLNGSQLQTSTEGEGDAGNITIEASDRVTFSGTRPDDRTFLSSAITQVATGAEGNGGTISITTGTLEVSDNARLLANTNGVGDAGTVVITAQNRVRFDGGDVLTSVTANAEGKGGDITLTTPILDVVNGGQLQANSSGQGDAGTVTIADSDRVTLSGSTPDGRIRSSILTRIEPGAVGQGGDIDITTDQLAIRNGGALSASTFGAGDAGDVTLTVGDRIIVNGGNIFSQVNSGAMGNSGTISITASNIALLNGSRVETSSSGEGRAGDVILNATDQVVVNSRPVGGNQVTAVRSSLNPDGIGRGGSIQIVTGNLDVLNSAQLVATTEGQGNAGNVIIEARDRVRFDSRSSGEDYQSLASSVVEETGIGDGGNIQISATTLEILNGAQLQASTTGQGNAGRIDLNVEDRILFSGQSLAGKTRSSAFSTVEAGAVGNGNEITIHTRRVEIRNGAALSTSTLGQGDAGRIYINATDRVSVIGGQGSHSATSGILSVVQKGAVGNANTIEIETDVLDVRAGAVLATSTDGDGHAGNIVIQADDRVIFDRKRPTDNADNASSTEALVDVGSTVEEDGMDNGGDVMITTRRLEIRNGALLSTSTLGAGSAGQVRIEAHDRVIITGTSADGRFPSRVTTTVDLGAIGDGNTISIATEQLTIRDGALITASTNGTGRAGDITIQAPNIQLEQGRISTKINPEGVSEQPSQITIDTRSLQLTDNSRITTRVAGTGNAGQITIQNANRVVLSDSNIVSRVIQNGNGDGGNIRIQTGNLQMSDRATITAQSDVQLTGIDRTNRSSLRSALQSTDRSPMSPPLDGDAGNIFITVDEVLFLEDSDITSQAQDFAGGEITIRAGDIRLRGDGDIQTNVRGAAGGGNIQLTANTILAFGDSDIVSSAAAGVGGDITLNTPAFFGAALQINGPDHPDGNGRVDINATGTVNGVVTTPDVSFIQNGLNTLSDALIDPETLIANSCVARNQDGRSTFVITGTGGLRDRPGDLARPHYSTGEVQTIPIRETETQELSHVWQSGDLIIEPQGVYQLPNGELILSHACGTSPHPSSNR